MKIIGEGPDSELVQQVAQKDPRIERLGKLPLAELLDVVGNARALITPSLWNETFGRTTIEAFSKGTPVIGSRIGGTAELIDEERTGWLYPPGSANDLRLKVREAMQLDDEKRWQMRRAARQQFLENYLPENNYRALINCYQQAIALSQQVEQA